VKALKKKREDCFEASQIGAMNKKKSRQQERRGSGDQKRDEKDHTLGEASQVLFAKIKKEKEKVGGGQRGTSRARIRTSGD